MRSVNLILETERGDINPEFIVKGIYENIDTGKKPVFVIPEKEVVVITRLVKVINNNNIEYKMYSIDKRQLERNIKEAQGNEFRLEKINFRDGDNRIIYSINKEEETEEMIHARVWTVLEKFMELEKPSKSIKEINE